MKLQLFAVASPLFQDSDFIFALSSFKSLFEGEKDQ